MGFRFKNKGSILITYQVERQGALITLKRTYKYAHSAILTAAIVMPAFAQDNFPDVADNHWAFEALGTKK